MSFILDALRKSETERQQQSVPGLADAQYRSNKAGRSIWIPLLVIVLAANAIVFAFVMNADSPESETAVDNTAPAMGSRPTANPAVRPLVREIPDKNLTPAIVADDSQSAPTRTDPAAAKLDASISTDPAPVETGAIQEGPPSLQQLVASGQLSMQPLHLDIHVYSDAQPERFVFINMKKYREGEMLAEGPKVQEITRTGVILDYRGDQFTLDRD